MGFGPPVRDSRVRLAIDRALERGALVAEWPGRLGDHPLEAASADPFIHQELTELMYHTLWETVHVFFEQQRIGHDVGASAFLYPFLGSEGRPPADTLAEVAASILQKGSDDERLRAAIATEQAAPIAAAAVAIHERLSAGGALIAFGNGGSATDANDLVLDCIAPPPGLAPVRAISLAMEPANISAIGNDVGVELVFLRQLIAVGRPHDVAVAISTSGKSKNVCAALREGKKRGMFDRRAVGLSRGPDRGGAFGGSHRHRPLGLHPSAARSASLDLSHAPPRTGPTRHGPMMNRRGLRISIGGVVQGVGFRPFVYRLAQRHEIAGWVLNGPSGVEIHAEGAAADLQAFVADLQAAPPAAAVIAAFEARATAPEGLVSFRIRESRERTQPTVRVAADLAICPDCLRELNDPGDRRYQYPYLNCTNCGPRYSIIRALPYDRARTTMAAWPLCEPCRHEYENPADRRYHAQPTACPACGPKFHLELSDAASLAEAAPAAADSPTSPPTEPLVSPARHGESAIRRAAEMLRRGMIVAIKGIGGYHLACDAGNAAAVAALRERKFRKEQPFAMLVRDLDEARSLAALTPEHERLLGDVARPIVLAPAKRLLPGIAPDNDALGIMLPYAPLHHLLFRIRRRRARWCSPAAIGRASRSPICDDDARERLSGIADALLIGERPIARRVDDSVVAPCASGQPFMIRRCARLCAGGHLPAADRRTDSGAWRRLEKQHRAGQSAGGAREPAYRRSRRFSTPGGSAGDDPRFAGDV